MSDEAIVKALTERLSLALRATASQYRNCDPRPDLVLESLGDYLLDPDRATQRLVNEEARLKRLGLMR